MDKDLEIFCVTDKHFNFFNDIKYKLAAVGKEVKKLPMSLGEALEALDNDEVIKSSMPGEMYRVFEHYKRDEWERFMHTTTEWDMETYLDCLP